MGNQTSAPLRRNSTQIEKSLQDMKRGTEVVGDSRNAKLVKRFLIDAGNRGEVKARLNFCAPDSAFYYKGADSGLPLEMFMEAVEDLRESFPDITLSFDEIKETTPNVVSVNNFRTKDTHTGKPFSFANFPPVQTTGIAVEERPFNLTIHMEGGKMTSLVLSLQEGALVGPAGYYVQIGGKIEGVN